MLLVLNCTWKAHCIQLAETAAIKHLNQMKNEYLSNVFILCSHELEEYILPRKKIC